jgi:hypothetical protein
MTTVVRSPPTVLQFFGNNGLPLIGGTLLTQVGGVNTATYQDAAGTIPLPNPIPLNSRGEISNASGVSTELWLISGTVYTFTLYDALGNQIGQYPNISGTIDAATLSAPTGSGLVGFQQSGAGAVATDLQTKVQSVEVSIYDFFTTAQKTAWAARDTTNTISTAIQSALNALNTANGGRLKFPVGRGNLGTVGLTTYQNVRLVGEAQPYTASNARGVELIYSGTGSAIFGISMLNGDIENFSIDATNATGSAVRGIYFQGAWLCTLRNVRVKGVTPALGYSILIDTNAGAWGAQHNYLERVEAVDGVIRLSGTGPSDEVTTTVFNTIRGFQYQINYSQVLALNSTAENWTTGPGWTFTNNSDALLLHCDIEGNGTPGISIDGSSVVREFGTTWGGFTGTNRVTGNMTAFDMWGGGWIFKDVPSAGSLFNSSINWSNFAQFLVRANNVIGGTQDGNLEVKRFIAGTQLNQFEWRNQFKIETSKSIGNVATTFLTIPIGSGLGAKVRVVAQGIQPAAGWFCVERSAVVVDDTGTLTITSATALTAATGGSTPVITFTASAANLLVQFNHGSATPSPISFIVEIDGYVTTYTKG